MRTGNTVSVALRNTTSVGFSGGSYMHETFFVLRGI